MPSDPAASVCLNMWSAGRGTLNGEKSKGNSALGRLNCEGGWQQGEEFACGMLCMTLVPQEKPGLGHREEVLGRSGGYVPASRRCLLGCRCHTLCCVFWWFCSVLWGFSTKKIAGFKVKMVREGRKHQPTKKQNGKRLHSVQGRVLVQTHQTFSLLSSDFPRRGFCSSASLGAPKW